MKYLLVVLWMGLVLQPSNRLVAQADARIENLVLGLSAEKFNYMNPGKLDKLKPLLDENLIFIHSNGLTETKEQMVQNLTDGKWNLRGVEVKEASVRVFKNNTAIITGKALFHATAAGKDVDLDLYYTEIWMLVNKSWLLTSRHALKL
ncbi:MAG: nuclear transport factor 2 family protein [Saprospiraceae bacterium]|nr:nuclear transport factor 2 family protein [Saprospiraceae bacterium]